MRARALRTVCLCVVSQIRPASLYRLSSPPRSPVGALASSTSTTAPAAAGGPAAPPALLLEGKAAGGTPVAAVDKEASRAATRGGAHRAARCVHLYGRSAWWWWRGVVARPAAAAAAVGATALRRRGGVAAAAADADALAAAHELARRAAGPVETARRAIWVWGACAPGRARRDVRSGQRGPRALSIGWRRGDKGVSDINPPGEKKMIISWSFVFLQLVRTFHFPRTSLLPCTRSLYLSLGGHTREG